MHPIGLSNSDINVLHRGNLFLADGQVRVPMIALLEFKALCEQLSQQLRRPLGGRQILQQKNGLLEGHLLDLLRELKQECGAHVAMELREAVLLREVSIPDTQRLVESEFSGKEASHPAVGEVVKFDFLFIEMRHQLRVREPNDCLHFGYAGMYARLMVGEVVEHAIQHFREAPESVCLSCK